MATTASRTTLPAKGSELLRTGDRMSREEFHRLYEGMPANFKAELIGGIVYVASPSGDPHGSSHLLLGTLVGTYSFQTPGVAGSDNGTVILGRKGEPQPDLFLRNPCRIWRRKAS